MKVRHGFVSNSSSTSFCIYGAYVDKTEDMGWKANLWEAATKLGLHVQLAKDDDGVYVGRKYDTLKDDETGEEFKKDAEKKLRELLGDDFEQIRFICEGWYDG